MPRTSRDTPIWDILQIAMGRKTNKEQKAIKGSSILKTYKADTKTTSFQKLMTLALTRLWQHNALRTIWSDVNMFRRVYKLYNRGQRSSRDITRFVNLIG